MRRYIPALGLAALILAVAALAAFGWVSGPATQWAPVALLALFPGAWLGTCRTSRAKV